MGGVTIRRRGEPRVGKDKKKQNRVGVTKTIPVLIRLILIGFFFFFFFSFSLSVIHTNRVSVTVEEEKSKKARQLPELGLQQSKAVRFQNGCLSDAMTPKLAMSQTNPPSLLQDKGQNRSNGSWALVGNSC